MDIMIASPAYGGMVTSDYALSLAATTGRLYREQIPHLLMLLANEALVNRARNKVAKALLDSECDRMIFIDSDI